MSIWINDFEKKETIIQRILKDSDEDSDDFDSHSQTTPFSLCVEMVNKIGNYINEEKEWLIIANIEFVYTLRDYFKFRNWNFERVTFATPSKSKAEFAKALGIKNIIKYSYLDIKEWTTEDGGKKVKEFDVIIGNPPYKKGLHMEILDKCYNLLKNEGHLLFVHPATKFIRPPKKLTKLFRDIISLDFRNGETLFNVRLWVPVSITHIQKNINSDIFKLIVDTNEKNTTIKDVPALGLSDELISFRTKISQHSRFKEFKTELSNFNFYVHVSGFGGHARQTDEFYLSPKTKSIVNNSIGKWHNFGFNTKVEALNCENYLRSKFAMRCLSLIKINQHIENVELNSIPYLDFTKSWSDGEIYNYFNLSQNEINFVELMPAHPLRK